MHAVSGATEAPDIEPFSLEQARQLLTTARGERLEALFVLAVHTGLRQGEMLGLRWDDVDLALDRGLLTVRATLQRRGGKWHFGDPKSKAGKRTVHLTEPVIAALRAHKVRQAQERLAAGPLWADFGVVFASETGSPLHSSNVHKAYWAVLDRAGLPRKRVHDLRHTSASLLVAEGMPIRDVAAQLGHQDPNLTVRIYMHEDRERRRQGVQKLANALS